MAKGAANAHLRRTEESGEKSKEAANEPAERSFRTTAKVRQTCAKGALHEIDRAKREDGSNGQVTIGGRSGKGQ